MCQSLLYPLYYNNSLFNQRKPQSNQNTNCLKLKPLALSYKMKFVFGIHKTDEHHYLFWNLK